MKPISQWNEYQLSESIQSLMMMMCLTSLCWLNLLLHTSVTDNGIQLPVTAGERRPYRTYSGELNSGLMVFRLMRNWIEMSIQCVVAIDSQCAKNNVACKCARSDWHFFNRLGHALLRISDIVPALVSNEWRRVASYLRMIIITL